MNIRDYGRKFKKENAEMHRNLCKIGWEHPWGVIEIDYKFRVKMGYKMPASAKAYADEICGYIMIGYKMPKKEFRKTKFHKKLKRINPAVLEIINRNARFRLAQEKMHLSKAHRVAKELSSEEK